MGYLLKLNNTKQQINFLNCDNIDKWIDTCQEVTKSYDVVDEDIDLPIEGAVIKGEVLIFEFVGTVAYFKVNYRQYAAQTTPYYTTLEDLGVDELTGCKHLSFNGSYITKLIAFPDTSNITDMSSMFDNCRGLTSLDFSDFNTSKVTNMQNMFKDCVNLISLNLSGWDTSNVTNMWSVFYGCHSLASLDLSSFDTSNVTDMGYMFDNCHKLTSLDLSGWDVNKVTSMGKMFQNCSNLQTIYMRGCDQASIDKIASAKPSQAQIITE